MNETVFDKEMKDMLHRCADELHAPDKLKTRVDFALKNGSSRPRRCWGRRLIALAAVAAITVTGAFAAGAFGSITSHSWSDQRLSLAQTQEHMEQAGVEFTLPESIGGFTFSHGYDADTLAESAAGEREQVKEVNAEYEKDGVTLNFSAHKVYTVFSDEESSDPEPDEVQEVNGVTLSFRDSHYRFVPPDYEPSDEEKKLERRGELTISEGSDEVEDRQFQSVIWEKDGMSYILYGFDTGLDAQTMLELASGLVA